MTLKKQLLSAFTIILVLMVTSSLVLWGAVNRQTQIAEEVAGDDVPGAMLYLTMIDEMRDMHAAALTFLHGESGQKDIFNSNYRQFMDAHQQLVPLESRSSQDREKMSRLADWMKAYHQGVNSQIFAVFDTNRHREFLQLHRKFEDQYLEPLEDILETSASEEESDARAALNTLVADLKMSLTILLVCTLIAIVIGVFVALYLSNRITSKVQKVLSAAEKIAQGDLSQGRVPHNGQDELDSLAAASNQMSDALTSLLRHIRELSHSVQDGSSQIDAISGSIATQSKASSSQSAQVATAIEEMSATIGEVAQQSQIAASSSDEAKNMALTGGKVVSETVSQIKSASTMVQTSAEDVAELGRLSTQIENIIGVIGSIAEQTNLLALNAAIESARAGEQGRGFAVVADEVRTLAARTTQATEEVAQSIRAIQGRTQQAVGSMNQCVQQVNRSVELAEEAGRSLEGIVLGAEQIAAMVQSIATATEEQSAVAQEMARDIAKIDDYSKQSLQDTQGAAQSAKDLMGKSQNLTESIARFKLPA
ncbi:methyl-accepting chemotaxis protein [Bowmanella denitrificans]|uniref:methyl-accepting chemotaxis protein n=1 Tax=Bowmanella denitrificans TaxID=366582 RepID=UPI000C9A5FD4|nr:methyl-accepting chemotaxis protein [Bowmanella denitrificans]